MSDPRRFADVLAKIRKTRGPSVIPIGHDASDDVDLDEEQIEEVAEFVDGALEAIEQEGRRR